MAKSKDTELVKSDSTSLLVEGPVSADELAANGYLAEINLSLKPGQTLEGEFLGQGGVVSLDNLNGIKDENGEIKKDYIPVWRIKHHSAPVVVNLLGASQLNEKFGAMQPGTNVIISHQGEVRSAKGRRVNNYLIFTRPKQ